MPPDNSANSSYKDLSQSPISELGTNSNVLEVTPATEAVVMNTPIKLSRLKLLHNKTIVFIVLLALLFIGAIGLGALALTGFSANKQPGPSTAQKVANYSIGKLSVKGLNGTASQLDLGLADHLDVNGQLQISNTIILSPTTTPTNPTAGQIYYDQNTNQLYYYNNSTFASLATSTQLNSALTQLKNSVLSLQSQSGTLNLAAGTGIGLNGLTITNTGVTSLQSQSGALDLTAGTGIGLNGLTITNNGVTSLSGTPDEVSVSQSTGNISLSLSQAIATTSSPSFAGLTAPTLTARPGDNSLTVGNSDQNLSLQGATTTLSDTAGGNVTTLAFATPNSTNTIYIPSAGGTICTSVDNCGYLTGATVVELQSTSPGSAQTGNINISGTAIAGAFSGDGTNVTNVDAAELNGQLPSYYLNASNISTGTLSNARLSTSVTLQGNSFNGASELVQLNGSGALPTVSGANLTSLNGSAITSGTVADNRLSSNVALLNATQTFTGTNLFQPTTDSTTALRIQNAAGTTTLFQADTTGSGALTLGVPSTFSSTVLVSGLLSANGGLTSSGTITFSGLATAGVVHTNGSGTLSTGAVVLGTETSGSYVANLGSLSGLTTTTGNSGAGSTPSLNVTYGSTANTAVQGNVSFVCPSGTGNLTGTGNTITLGTGGTCNSLTVVNSPTFSGSLTVQGSSVTIGSPGTTTGQLTLATAGSSSYTTSLQSTAQPNNLTLTIPADTNITDTVCLLTLANCTANGTAGGDLTGAYPNPTIAKLQGTTLTISSISSGQILQYNGSAIVNQTLSGDVTVNGSGVTAIGASKVTNADLANDSLTVAAGTGLTGGGSVALGSTSSGLNVTYGSTANTAVQGNVSFVCPSGTGNLTGTGNTITLGTGGTCNSLTVVNSPTFSGSLAVHGSSGIAIGVAGTTTGVLNFANNTNTNLGTLQTAILGQATTYTLPDPGVAAASICLSTGNCAGAGGGITGSGTSGDLAVFNNTGSVANSANLSESGSTVTDTGNLVIQGTSALSLGTASGNNGAIVFKNSTNNNTLTLDSGATATNLTFTLPPADGSNGYCLETNGGGVLTFASCTGGAGGGVTSLDAQTGILTLANSTGSSGTVTINNAKADASTEGIATFNSTNFTDNGAGTINTVQNIATTSSPTFATINGTTGLNTGSGSGIQRIDSSGNLVNIGTITSGTINSQTISSSANFTGTLTVQGSSVTIGSPGTTTGQLTLATAGSSSYTTSLQSTAQPNNLTLTIPADTNITDTVCLLTLANCTANGTAGGDLTGAYPNPTIAKLQGTTLTISSISSGQILQYNGSAIVNQTLSGDVTVNGSGVTAIGASKVTNADLANDSLTVSNGTNMTGGGAVSLGSSITLGVVNNPTFTGSVTASSNTTGLAVTGAPTNNATSSLLQLGNAIANGNTAANGGTYLGLNEPSSGTGSAADFVNLEVNGTSKLKVDNSGDITAGGTINGATISGGSLSSSAVNGLSVSSGTISSPTISGTVTGSGSPTITGFGTINGQTISSTANFTGTLAVTTLGSAGTTAVCYNSSDQLASCSTSSSSSYILNGTTVQSANLAIQNAGSITTPTAVVEQSSGQTANLLDFENSSGVVIASVDSSGDISGVNLTSTGTISGNGSGITSLNASNISTGTLSNARLSTSVTLQGNSFNGASELVQLNGSGALPTVSGANLTSLNGSAITSGTVADNRLSSNVALLNATQTFTGTNLFQPTTDSTTALRIQNAAGTTTLFQADTTGSGALTLGVPSTFSSTVLVSGLLSANGGLTTNGANITTSGGTINSQTISSAANFTGTLAVATLGATGNTPICLNTSDQLGTCITNASVITLQQSYNVSVNPQLVLTTAGGALNIDDASTPLGTNLLTVQNHGGSINYLAVSASSTSITGMLNVTGTINSATISGGSLSSSAVNGLSVASGTITSPTISGTVTGSGSPTITGFGNITSTATIQGSILTGSTLELGGTNISTAGTLSNIAYLNQANSFSADNTFNGAGTGLAVTSNATVSGTINTNTFTASSLQFGASSTATIQAASSQALNITANAASTWSTSAGNLTIQAAGTSTLALDTASTGTVTVAGTNAAVLTLGNTGATVSINSGATLNVGNDAVNKTINIGATGTTANTTAVNIATSTGAAQTVTIGSTNTSSATTLQAGATSENLTSSGDTIQTSTNSTTAFQIQNAGSTALLTANTTNMRLGVDVTQATLASPGTLTISTTTTGGSLTAATYYYEVTAVDSAQGETTPSPQASQATTGSASTVTLQWTAVTGASGYKIYRSTVSGSETLYAYTQGTNTSGTISYTDIGNGPAPGGSPPAANTAYVSTNNSNNNNQVSIGGNGTPTGQLYVSGTVPSAATGSVSTGSSSAPYSVYVSGRYAYVANEGTNTLGIYDVSNPTSPISVGSVSTGSSSAPYSVYVSGRYAYVANEGTNTLGIYDVSNPASPVSVSTVSTGAGTSPSSVYVSGNYAYITDSGANTLQIFNISNPTSPTSVNTVTTGSTPYSVYVSGDYAYVANKGAANLQIFAISNPANPTIVGSVSTGSQPYSVYVSGSYAYVVNNSGNTLQIFDISNPASPANVGTVAVGTNPKSVYVQGRYAYVANGGSSTLQIVNVSNPTTPVSVGTVSTGSSSAPYSVYVSGRYAYVANEGTNNLSIYDLGGAYIQQLQTGGLETGTLQADGDANIGGDEAIQGGLQVGANLQVAGNAGINGSLNLTASAISTPGAPTLASSASGGSLLAATYYYKLAATTADGTTAAIASSPTSVTDSGSASQNTLTWTAVTGATGYIVYESTNGTTWYSDEVSGATTSIVDNGSTYTWANAVTPPTAATTGGNLTAGGTALFENASNSATAFQVQNASGVTLLGVNTTTGTIFSSVASGGTAFTLNTTNAFSSGNLLVLENNGTPALTVGYNGNTSISGNVAASSIPSTVVTESSGSAYTASYGNEVVVTSSSNFTVTLPTALANAEVRIDNEGSAVTTVSTPSGDIIGLGTGAGGETSIPLGAVGAYVQLVSNGTNWYIVGGEQDSGWITATLQNGFVNAGGNAAVSYRLQGNIVRLGGQTQSGTNNSTVFTLPAAFRPPWNRGFSVYSEITGNSVSGAMVSVTNGGNVILLFNSSSAWDSLDGITFTVD